MSSLHSMVVFAVGMIGFFGAIGGMIAWLTRVEQNLPYLPREDLVTMPEVQEDLVGALVPEPAVGE